jgi:hypothetical protein
MLGALLRGVSTRQHEEVLPEMAETAGTSFSEIAFGGPRSNCGAIRCIAVHTG